MPTEYRKRVNTFRQLTITAETTIGDVREVVPDGYMISFLTITHGDTSAILQVASGPPWPLTVDYGTVLSCEIAPDGQPQGITLGLDLSTDPFYEVVPITGAP